MIPLSIPLITVALLSIAPFFYLAYILGKNKGTEQGKDHILKENLIRLGDEP